MLGSILMFLSMCSFIIVSSLLFILSQWVIVFIVIAIVIVIN